MASNSHAPNFRGVPPPWFRGYQKAWLAAAPGLPRGESIAGGGWLLISFCWFFIFHFSKPCTTSSAHGFRVESTPPKISPNGAPPGAKVETKNHHKTMKIKVPEAEILRTPIKIEKLSLWNRSRSGFIMNFEFHRFLDKKTLPPLPPLSYSSSPSHHMGSLPSSWGSSANPKTVNRRSVMWVGVLPS